MKVNIVPESVVCAGFDIYVFTTKY